MRVHRGCAAGAILLAVGVLLAGAGRARGEVIRSFDADVWVMKDSTLEVGETIVMDFEQAQRHGLYRVIPTRYERDNNPYTTDLRLESVTDGDGRALHYSRSRAGSDVVLKIGDADKFVTGVHTYKLRYAVRRAVNFFPQGPEVYWNATGNQWPFAMASVTATVHLPAGVSSSAVRAKCFVGVQGSTQEGEVFRPDGETVTFMTPGLRAGEGLTLLAGLPAGSVEEPSALTRFWWFFRDWWPLFALPLVTAGLVEERWRRHGRDEGAGGAIPVEWEAPDGLSPAEVGTLIDEKCDTSDVVATLVDLAARGFMTIKEVPTEKFLFFSGKDYEFVRATPPPANQKLSDHEATFLTGVFSGRGDVARLSALKGKFYPYLGRVRDAVYKELTERQYFTVSPATVRNTFYGIGVAVLIGGFMLLVWGAGAGQISYGLGAMVSGIIVLVAAPAMPAKTRAGTMALRQVKGFQRFMAMVEKERIEAVVKTDPTVFGRLLPYAMVLGVADQWANAFSGLLTQPPDWYQPAGYGPGYNFNPYWFLHDLGTGMRTMQQTMAAAPPSSSSHGAGGGYSGFSSGGGFSGGGFGGGGGGSW